MIRSTISIIAFAALTLSGGAHAGIFEDVPYLVASPTPAVANILSDETSTGNASAAIATDGETLVVGLPHEAGTISRREGRVDIFRRVGTSWIHEQTLRSPDNLAEFTFGLPQFGNSVAVEGDRIVVGSVHYNTTPEAHYNGAVEIYERDSEGQWAMTQRLTDDYTTGAFGQKVQLRGDEIVVAGRWSRTFFHYRLVEGEWQRKQAVPLPPPPENSSLSDLASVIDVAFDGNSLVVVRQFSDSEGNVGYAQVYQRSDANSEWEFETTLVSSSPSAGTAGVELVGNTIVLAKFGITVFERGPTGWAETALLEEAGKSFGTSVQIDPSEKTIVVAVGNDEIGGVSELFSVAVIEKTGSTWAESGRQALPASHSARAGEFGRLLALVPGEPQVLAIAKVRTSDYAQPVDFRIFTLEPDLRSSLYQEYAVAAGQDPADNTAAFRYKVHLYGPNPENPAMLIPTPQNAATFYDATAAATAAAARDNTILALTRFPESRYYQDLLLDIVYDQTVAQTIPANLALENIDLLRINPPSSASGFVIDDEIAVYETILAQFRLALSNPLDLLKDPMLAEIFAERSPLRPLQPAFYLNAVNELTPTTAGALLAGHKDGDLFFNILAQYGSAAAELAHLHFLNGDPESAAEVLGAARQYTFIHGNTVRSRLVDAEGEAPELLATSLASWTQAQADLAEAARQIDTPLNPLGFSENFLVLFNRQDDENENLFNTFDILISRVNNASGTFNQIVVAEQAQTTAIDAYDNYRGNLDTLAHRLLDVTEDAKLRLIAIVGAPYGSPAYNAVPDRNPGSKNAFINGSELWQQIQNIERARLAIDRNRTLIRNIHREVLTEMERNLYEVNQNNAIRSIRISYGDKRASAEQSLARIEATQAATEAFAGAMNPANIGEGIARAVNGGVQVGGELLKGELRAQKERNAALEQADIIDVENRVLNANSVAKVRTLLLQMNTLAIDSTENAILLSQEMGRLVGLYREKHTLERRILTHSSGLQDRYFSDPVHRLRFLYELHIATRRFATAQQFTYFLARALEYKWNEPFDTIMAGSGYTFSDIFRVRNAKEIRLMVEAMEARDNLRSLPGFGAEFPTSVFSLRQDAFNLVGDSPETIQEFRETLQTLLVGGTQFQELIIPFSTVRDPLNSHPASSFFRGPRNLTVQPDGTVTAQNNGRYLDKIVTLQITIPGSHTVSSSNVASTLSYGGTALIRERTLPEYPDYDSRPDRLAGEFVAYPTMISSFTGTAWQTSSTLAASPTAMLRNDTPPASENAVAVFRERSVATSGWVLQLLVRDGGTAVLNIDEIDDIRIHFHHRAVTRQSN